MVTGASTTRSSVYTIQSKEKSTIEVGQGNVKLTFSTDEGKMINYVNSRSLVCAPPQSISVIILSLLPPDISVSLLLKVEESVQQSYSFYNGYNGSYDKPPLIPQVYAY